MAEVETRHIGERSPNEAPAAPIPRSPRRDHDRARPRDGGDSYRPSRGRDRRSSPPHQRSPPPRQRTPPKMPTEEEKQAAAKAEYQKLLSMRSGGTYIPPARLRALQAQITDKTSKEYQRMAWEALKKSINGLINKVNVSNIKHIVPELFQENLVRGRGLFCRSIMKAQAASLPFTPVLAAMAAIVNTKLPQVGELLIKRLVMQFRKAFKRNDKSVCLSSTMFIAHLVNQQVVHEMLAAQILLLLLQKPTDDSVEIAVGLTKEVGQHLEEMNPAIGNAVFDQFRNILHEADIDKRVQYMIEVLFQVRKDKFKDNPAIKEELDLIEEEDQITHRIELDGAIDVQDGLNIFKFDPEWEETEEAYKRLRAEILGEGSDDEDDDDDDESSEEENEEEKAIEIKDQSNTDLVNLRKTIYLTIMSSMDPEECVHKLMKVNLPTGQEPELPSMVVECCSQEKTYSKFFGLIGERFAKINRLWCDLFTQSFEKYYETIHRYETNRLRNIARFFGHMFGSEAIGWHAMSVIHLNEEETTSASRIFIKILFQEISEELGMQKLQARVRDESLQDSFTGLFPRDNPRNVRFSINYFTSIGMGALTEEMREWLANIPKPTLPAPPAAEDSDSDSVSSYSSYTGSSYSSRSRSRSRSRTPARRALDRGRSLSRTPPRRARSPSYSRSRSRSRSPSRSRSRSYSSSRSRSPRRAGKRYSKSPSPPTRRRRDSSPARYRSVTPPPARAAVRVRSRGRSRSSTRSRSYSSSRSRSPPSRRAAAKASVSRSPPPRRAPARRDSYSASPPRRARRDASSSRSKSPPTQRGRPARKSPSPPARRRRNTSSVSSGPRKRPRYDSRSPSPVNAKKRRYSSGSSRTRSRSPPPRKTRDVKPRG
ncbi:MIF4G-domain-containing protein [Hypoxylon fragiforme]|uniref:MIF4G-domain-containing protein n=1 Tax=Hypoxylon fragiforme TaxID=63214 RepID=UPI0020C5D5D4|nr:MIF4G-domain-containing protein [Hypoxylon fragiforme]KAI2612161.1 MIF4G-domain-containing protein [Hypoxylon fragiforme]